MQAYHGHTDDYVKAFVTLYPCRECMEHLSDQDISHVIVPYEFDSPNFGWKPTTTTPDFEASRQYAKDSGIEVVALYE